MTRRAQPRLARRTNSRMRSAPPPYMGASRQQRPEHLMGRFAEKELGYQGR